MVTQSKDDENLYRRIHPRFKFEVKVKIRSPETGWIFGDSIDISETGMSATLVFDAHIGEAVVLDFELPRGKVTVRAVVRNQSAFRFGFEFVRPNPVLDLIHDICIWLPRCE